MELKHQILQLQTELKNRYAKSLHEESKTKMESDFGSAIDNEEGDDGLEHYEVERKRDVKRDEKAIEEAKKARRPKIGWSDEETTRFIQAVELYGKDFQKITAHIETKDISQVRSQSNNLLKRFRADPSLKGAHIIEILQKPLQRGRRKKTEV